MFNAVINIFRNYIGAQAPYAVDPHTDVAVEGSAEAGHATPFQDAHDGVSMRSKATADRLSMPHPLGTTL